MRTLGEVLYELRLRAETRRTDPEVLALAQSTVWPNSEIIDEIEALQRDFGEREGIEIARRMIADGFRPRAYLRLRALLDGGGARSG